jgi:hypothetical protein
MPRAALGALFAATLFSGAAFAQPWQLAQSIGPVWYGQDETKLVALGPNVDVPAGSTVVTGEGGRAMLVRGEQTMLVGPNAVVIVSDEQVDGFTTVLQRAGEVTFDVDRQKVQHFAVETPYLAAVVKGTNFTVNVADTRAAVSVNRGLVDVADLATGQHVDTATGQRAFIDDVGQALNIAGNGLLAMVTQGAARAPLVKPLTTSELRVMQVKATGSVQAQNNNGANSALAALGAGAGVGPTGGSGSGSNGDGSSDASGSAGNNAAGIASLDESVALDVVSNTVLKRRKSSEPGVTPLMFVAAVSAMTLLAVGLAYVRRNS